MLPVAILCWAVGLLLLWRVPMVGAAGRSGASDISVIVPARDEAENIERLVRSLDGSAPLEILVVDDGSVDETATRASAAGATVLPCPSLPEGWAGKSWACLHGARQARGRRLLFLDADAWLAPGALERIASHHDETGGVLTIQPYHRMERAYERLSALFNLITLMGSGAFTPFGARLATGTAFGPSLLVEREAYFGIGGHERSRAAVLEGLPLGRAFAAAGHRVHSLGGRGVLFYRMYPGGLREMIDGFAKGFATGAGGVPAWILLAVVAWVVGGVSTTRHATGFALGVPGESVGWLAMAAAYAAQMRWMLRRAGNYGWWPALAFPLVMVFFIGVFGLSLARTAGWGRREWKGRRVTPK